jgi:hypothetical protein
MPNNNNGNTWSSSIRGRAMRENLLHEYTLKTLAVPDSDAQSPFQYSIFSVSLTEVRKPIPKDLDGLQDPILLRSSCLSFATSHA